MAGPVILRMKLGLFLEFLMNKNFLCVCYLEFDWFGWIALIKSEVLIRMAMAWPVTGSDKWKAPSVVTCRTMYYWLAQKLDCDVTVA